MSLFDHLHEHFFEQLFGFDAASRQELARIAREHGIEEAIIQDMLAGKIRTGTKFGAAHPIDAKSIIERVLFRQGAQGLTLRITRWPHDEAGHLDIEIVEIIQDEPKSEHDKRSS